MGHQMSDGTTARRADTRDTSACSRGHQSQSMVINRNPWSSLSIAVHVLDEAVSEGIPVVGLIVARAVLEVEVLTPRTRIGRVFTARACRVGEKAEHRLPIRRVEGGLRPRRRTAREPSGINKGVENIAQLGNDRWLDDRATGDEEMAELGTGLRPTLGPTQQHRHVRRELVRVPTFSDTQRHSEARRGTQRHSEALSGTRWHSVALSGTRWHSVALSGTRWHSVALSGTQWHSVALSGTRWHSVALSGTQWHSVALSGTRWHSVALGGTQWHSVALGGTQYGSLQS